MVPAKLHQKRSHRTNLLVKNVRLQKNEIDTFVPPYDLEMKLEEFAEYWIGTLATVSNLFKKT
jgi:hypothetical protein